jgi:hypothetical protein
MDSFFRRTQYLNTGETKYFIEFIIFGGTGTNLNVTLNQ